MRGGCFSGSVVGGSSQRRSRVVKIGPITFTLSHGDDGLWSAYAVFGQSSGHREAQEAVAAILAAARPMIGIKAYSKLEEAFRAIQW